MRFLQRGHSRWHGRDVSRPPNVWRQWRAQRVHCTPGLGHALELLGMGECVESLNIRAGVLGFGTTTAD